MPTRPLTPRRYGKDDLLVFLVLLDFGAYGWAGHSPLCWMSAIFLASLYGLVCWIAYDIKQDNTRCSIAFDMSPSTRHAEAMTTELILEEVGRATQDHHLDPHLAHVHLLEAALNDSKAELSRVETKESQPGDWHQGYWEGQINAFQYALALLRKIK